MEIVGRKPVVCLLSGGVDSVVMLLKVIASRQFTPVALTFDYGQLHKKEIEYAANICSRYSVRHVVVKIPSGVFAENPLFFGGDLSAPIVPNRNMVFLSIGVAFAVSVGAQEVLIGCNENDSLDFPDCRKEFIEAVSLASVSACGVKITAPLLRYSKEDVIDEAKARGLLPSDVWSCYAGGEKPCGLCGACKIGGVW